MLARPLSVLAVVLGLAGSALAQTMPSKTAAEASRSGA